MHETSDDLAELQRLLDESYASAGEHLRSLFVPERRSSAPDIVAALPGAFMINLATVTVRCEPVVAPVDGLFYRGRLWFSLPPGAQRARHLRARPQVSATYVEGDPGACMIVHGEAVRVDEAHPFFTGFDRFARSVYGLAVDFAKEQYSTRTGPDFTGFIEPRRIYAQDFPKAGSFDAGAARV
jgi:hypothetical protein